MTPDLRALSSQIDDAVRTTQLAQPGPGLALIAQRWHRLIQAVASAPEVLDDSDEPPDDEWMAMGDDGYVLLLGATASVIVGLDGKSPRMVRISEGTWSAQIDYGDPKVGSDMGSNARSLPATSPDMVSIRVADDTEVLLDWTISSGQSTDNRDITAQLEEAQAHVAETIERALERLSDLDDDFTGMGGSGTAIGVPSGTTDVAGDALRGAAGAAATTAAAAATALAARKLAERGKEGAADPSRPPSAAPSRPPPAASHDSEALCPACGAPLRPHAHFCLACGAKVAASIEWHPTHRTGASAQHLWQVPDPSTAPMAQLRPGLDVEVRQVRGAWCEIRLENGWTGWADLRRLVPR